MSNIGKGFAISNESNEYSKTKYSEKQENKEEKIYNFFSELNYIESAKDHNNKEIDIELLKMFKLNLELLTLIKNQQKEIDHLKLLFEHEHHNNKLVRPILSGNIETGEYIYNSFYDLFLNQIKKIFPMEL